MGVAVSTSLKNLVGELLDCFRWKWSSNGPHVLFEVVLAVFEDQIEVVFLVDDFHKAIQRRSDKQNPYLLDYIWVPNALEQ